MSSSFNRIVLLLAAAVSPVVVQAASIARQMPVSYSDLDLATPEGRKQLDRRVDRAAREVCFMNSSTDRKSHNAAKACHAETMKQTAADVAAAASAPKAGDAALILVRSR